MPAVTCSAPTTTAPPVPHRSPESVAHAWIPGVVLVALAVAPFWHVWASVGRIGLRESSLGYLLLIPVAVGLLIWQRRKRLLGLSVRHRWVGLVVAAAGVVLYRYADRLGPDLVGPLAWFGGPVLVVYGAVIAWWGTSVVVPLAAAFGVLLLVVPPPESIVTAVAFQLMFVSATVTTDVLRLLGYDVQQYLHLLVINGNEVNVAEACSGIRSFFALGVVITVFSLSLPFVWWLRIGMIALTPVMAVLGNMLRLIPTSMMYGSTGEGAAGLAHDVLGIVSFASIVMVYLGLLSLVRWTGLRVFQSPKPRSEKQRDDKVGQTKGEVDSLIAARGTPPHRFGVVTAALAVGLLGVTAVTAQDWPTSGVSAYHRQVAEQVREARFTLPGMTAVDSGLPGVALDMLRPNAFRCVRLVDPQTGSGVYVSLIHCRYVRDMLHHTPPVCYPNSGWVELARQRDTVAMADEAVPVTEYRFQRMSPDGSQDIYVMNAFITPDGQVSADQADAVGQSAFQGIRDAWGVAQLSLLFDAQTTREQRRALASKLLTMNAGVINEIRRTVSEVDR